MRIAAIMLGAVLAMPMLAGAAEQAAAKAAASKGMFSGAMVQDRPIDIGIDVRGVKMESVYFNGTEAMVILWNRSSKPARTVVDVAVFNKEGKMIAVGQKKFSLAGSSIRAGKQANVNLDFSGYLPNFSEAASFAATVGVSEVTSNTSD